ncbi:MAG: class B sortase [Clostridia bacterium]|nr:class B sortase [Clostridia bacterium]
MPKRIRSYNDTTSTVPEKTEQSLSANADIVRRRRNTPSGTEIPIIRKNPLEEIPETTVADRKPSVPRKASEPVRQIPHRLHSGQTPELRTDVENARQTGRIAKMVEHGKDRLGSHIDRMLSPDPSVYKMSSRDRTAAEQSQREDIPIVKRKDIPHRRAERSVRKTGGRFSENMIRRGIMLLLAGIALFSLIMILRIVDRSIRTSRLNQTLAEKHSQAANNVDTESLIIYTLPDNSDPETIESEEKNAYPLETVPETDTPVPAPAATPTPVPLVLSTRFHQIGGEALPEMGTLYSENSDLVGWLNIRGVIDLPVVYKNNVYYLTHDFYKKNNTSGTLFLDENHPYKEKTQNLLLHGHNMRDGSMFGRLIQYKSNLSFLKSNCLIDYSSLWQHEEYVIFSVLQVSLEPRDPTFFNYFTHATFRSDEEFTAYVTELMSRSIYAIPVDVKPGDALITLSTCLDDDRLIVVGRKRREGESQQRLRELVSTAVKQ